MVLIIRFSHVSSALLLLTAASIDNYLNDPIMGLQGVLTPPSTKYAVERGFFLQDDPATDPNELEYVRLRKMDNSHITIELTC